MADNLPPLPETKRGMFGFDGRPATPVYTAEQMHVYARAALAQAQSCVPDELRAEAHQLANILSGMVEGGYADLETLYTDDQADGDAFVKRAAEVLAMIAASPQPQPVQPSEPITYTPGKWFDAATADLMQAFFEHRLPAIREAAKEHGYAIGLHGSMRRDLDLIAAPWRDDASDADTLAHAIAMAACGITRAGTYDWEQKPAGRVATCIPICWTHRHGVLSDGHIDLSVAPIAQAKPEQADHPEQDLAMVDERKAFEAWFEPHWNGAQSDLAAWAGWQARAGLSAQPPQQERVPLTEVQINAIHRSIEHGVCGLAFGMALARAVEAAHHITKKE